MLEPVVIVEAGSLVVALRATTVREVLGPRPWLALQGTRPELPGVLAWAGRGVAVLDLSRLVPEARPLAPGEARERTLIVEVLGSALAIPADRVSEVREVDSKDIRPRQVSDFALASHEIDLLDRVLPLFDPELLVRQATARTT